MKRRNLDPVDVSDPVLLLHRVFSPERLMRLRGEFERCIPAEHVGSPLGTGNLVIPPDGFLFTTAYPSNAKVVDS